MMLLGLWPSIVFLWATRSFPYVLKLPFTSFAIRETSKNLSSVKNGRYLDI